MMKQISAEELKKMTETTDNLRVIDVRPREQFDNFNINAHWLPLEKIKMMETDEIDDWKEDAIVVHCHTGKDSMEACLYLSTLGFTQLSSLTGGIEAWKEKFGEEKLK